MKRVSVRAFVLVLACLSCMAICRADETAAVTGLVTDPAGKSVPGVTVLITNLATNLTSRTVTNDQGIYWVPALQPGIYRMTIDKDGFKSIVKSDIELHIQDVASINFELQVGSVNETVTVSAGGLNINTTDASVSTVVDRKFVENMPLNGRSFQTLIDLTPGVVLTPATGKEPGQFSVNGQRADANYFTIDGVSANIGAAVGIGQSVGGALPGLSAQGGTNGLVSVDAVQEFRIQTSSFAPEFGRSPGGEVSIVTRSGNNQFHGVAFDYFRNDVLDANNWFADRDGLAKPEERQNDFGGTFGGPLIKDRTFFFFSYEGLRLRQPLTQLTTVPDTASRQAPTPPAVQALLNAFPVQNGPELGSGFAQFNASYSNPSTLDNYSIRLDQIITPKHTFFARYSYSPSETDARSIGALSETTSAKVINHVLTVGLTSSFTSSLSNELRANYSNSKTVSFSTLDTFGGAVPLSDSAVFPSGFSSNNSGFGVQIGFLAGTPNLGLGRAATIEQRQVNAVDNVSASVGAHRLKFGVDYRWLGPINSPFSYFQDIIFNSISDAVAGTVDFAETNAFSGSSLRSHNFSLYGQDTWQILPRLTVTYGLRWDVNPAPTGKNSASDPFTVQGLDNPTTMTLAPRGTPLYATTYGNVAPRLGAAIQIVQTPGRELVLRSGFGTFYDLGTGNLGLAVTGFPYQRLNFLSGVPYPLTPQQAAPPPFTLTPVNAILSVAVPNLALPRTYEWNVALEQAIGSKQSLSVTYVGAAGRKLLRQYNIFLPNPQFESLGVTGNEGTSDYDSLQIQFQRRISHGLQGLVSYTLAHSIDNASNDSTATFIAPLVRTPSLERGNSDFDIRNKFTGAISYDLPSPRNGSVLRSILGDWSLDSFVIAQAALPVDITGGVGIANNTFFLARPDVSPGVPLYLFGSQFPGGKAFNPTAFTAAPFGQQGDFGRNVLRGFGATQVDFALRKQFHLTERVGLQFRSEFFNIFNHPNFGNPESQNLNIASPIFGQSTQTLATSLAGGGLLGGFNPLYQIGGPRSVQFALRLQF